MINSLNVTKRLSYVLIAYFDLQALILVFKCKCPCRICESVMGMWFGTLSKKHSSVPTVSCEGSIDYLAMLH